jgi:two-component system, cell cycle sensor histidine kinase and response regulator CckA
MYFTSMMKEPSQSRSKTPPIPKLLLVILAAMVTGILVIGYYYFDSQKAQLKNSRHDELRSVAEIKSNQISEWRSERIGDGYIIQQNPFVVKAVRAYLKTPEQGASKGALIKMMTAFRTYYGYDGISLFDPHGNVRLSVEDPKSRVGLNERIMIGEVLRTKRVTLSDLHMNDSNAGVCLDLIVPVVNESTTDSTVGGVFVLSVDPSLVLFPLIQGWPTPSRTAETLLLRRDGSNVIYLNELRHQSNTALKLQFPDSLALLPASMAVRGIEGTVEGLDYRGVPVLASIKKIPDSPWYMIAKIDQNEVYAGLHQQQWIAGIVIGLLILLSAAFVASLWRREHTKFYRTQYQAELERRMLVEHFSYLVKYANDIIILANDQLKIIDANDRALEMYGYTHEEITSLHARDLRAAETTISFQEQITILEQNQSNTFETVHRRKDGSTFPVEISNRLITIDGIKFYQAIIRDISERRRVDEELRERDYWLHESQRVAGIGSYRLDFKAGIWKSSEILEKIFGIGKNYERSVAGWGSIIHPDDREMMLRYFSEIGKTRSRFDKEYRIVRFNDNQCRWVWGLGELSYDAAGDTIEMYGTIQDITYRKEKEIALQQSQIQYKQLIEQAADGIFMLNADGRFIMVNSKICEMLGYASEELLLLNILDTYPDELRDIGRQRFNRINKGESLRFERLIKRKDGSIFYVEISASLLQDGRQQAFMRDVTERRKADEALRQSNAFNEMLIKTLPFGIEIVDESGNILFMSDTMKQMLRKDATGECCWATYKDDHNQCTDCPLINGIELGETANLEVRNALQGKTLHINHVGITYEGKRAVLEVFQDVTEIKMLQNSLLQSQKIESLGTLAGGIAHDFNNILGIILAHASILSRVSSDPARLANSIESITKATERGESVVRQLLTFARKNEIKFESVRVTAIIKELVELIRETFPKAISIKTSVPDNLPSIVGDATQLHQVFLNLCVNARDAMPKGGELSINASVIQGETIQPKYPNADSIKYFHITVSDTGTGMTEETRLRIFEPFFTTKDQGKGTGLGMSLVYGIMQSHHGFVDVESQLEKGTTFNLYLPILPAEKRPEKRAAVSSDAPGGTETILVVEDEEMLRDLLKMALEKKGYSVITAADGEEAVLKYSNAEQEIHLVLSDFGLPKVNGDQVYYTLKEIHPSVKMILASGYLEPAQKNEIMSAGVTDFIQKPYLLNEVLQKIRQAIDKS